uniref:Helicase C-terminal domain-containing protein n=1 Tax=Parascaris equorum TaxID=6256 RepID=A0A914RB52_PAREQ
MSLLRWVAPWGLDHNSCGRGKYPFRCFCKFSSAECIMSSPYVCIAGLLLAREQLQLKAGIRDTSMFPGPLQIALFPLDAVIRRLLSIHVRDPWAKTLVFTSIPSIIPVISELLQENNIPYRSYSVGRRQVTLAEFRLDPKIQVLVMPINQGARGLNLTVANNIIFVEPQLDASQLAQAIGRIDRIGQTRRMMIHHFVVYGSIEEHIHHRITDPQNTEWTVGDIKRLLHTGAQYFDQALNNVIF